MRFKGILLAQILFLSINFNVIMKQIKFPKFKDYTNQKVNFIQPKLDGHLAKIYKPKCDRAPYWQAFTKNNKVITEKLLAIDHIKKELDDLSNNSVVFAELHCPGVFASSVPTMLNNAEENLQLTVFAAPLLGNKDLSQVNLQKVMFAIRDLKLDATHADLIHTDYVDEIRKEALLEEAKEKKLEGWVLKENHMSGWCKLKPTKTIDAVVIGTYRSFSSTHYGGLQGIHIMVYKSNGKTHDLGHVGGGFSLSYRQSFDTQAKRDALIGKVCVVEFDCLAANGKLRFPRMAKDDSDNIIWRTDKNPKQCTMEQFE